MPADERAITRKARPAARTAASARPAKENKPSKPLDEIDEVLQLPAVMAKIQNAKKTLGVDAVGYVDRAIRLCWDAAFSPNEIAEGLGTGYKSANRISRAIRACAQVGLMSNVEGRFQVNKPEINRLKALSVATSRRK